MLIGELKKIIKGDVLDDRETIKKFSVDASLFEIKPRVVVSPKDSKDLASLVKFVSENQEKYPGLHLTPRSAGTDMTGGPLSDSIVVDFVKYFNYLEKSVAEDGTLTAGPGVYYRDFEAVALKSNLFLPSYPASKSICAIGGMVNNNSGGEKSLIYGKTDKFVKEMKVVLADGNEYSVRALNLDELKEKKRQINFEGEIYRSIYKLLDDNYDLAKNARPDVSKNSVGYNIWDVWDRETGVFNLIKLFVGAQGTLGFMTEAKLSLAPIKPRRGMLIVYLKDISLLADVVEAILPFRPSSLESFDDHTFRLALKFIPALAKASGVRNIFSLFLKFIPDIFKIVMLGGMPRLILLVEFEGDHDEMINKSVSGLVERVSKLGVKTRVASGDSDIEKYFIVRRESFNLLRKKIVGRRAAPFIDDIVVKPKYLSQFLPELYLLLDKYKLLYTVAGHIGDGNFHIIPLMKLSDDNERLKIPEIMAEVYSLVLRYGGSISGEHNDGLLRGSFIKNMFGEDVFGLFKEIKKIFDPLNIFNPHKKTDANMEYSMDKIKAS